MKYYTVMTNRQFPRINITIPTYNRARLVKHAVQKSLQQNYPTDFFTVTVIDDGSADNTREVLEEFFDEPNFCYVQLAHNINTYQAKNLALLINDYDAITFHDSDDVPHEDKINIQSRFLFQHSQPLSSIDPRALNGDPLKDPEVCITGCKTIYPDGYGYVKHNPLSLFSDIFPQTVLPNIDKNNLIAPVNPSLFRKSLFERLGGYMNAPVSSDRELQSRIVLTDTTTVIRQEILYSKFKYPDSLTISEASNNNSKIRIDIHKKIHHRIDRLRKLQYEGFPNNEYIERIHIPDLHIEYISRPEVLTFNANIPSSPATAKKARSISHVRNARNNAHHYSYV